MAAARRTGVRRQCRFSFAPTVVSCWLATQDLRGATVCYIPIAYLQRKKKKNSLLCFDKKICQKVFLVLIIVITIILNAEDTVLTSIFKKVN